MSHDGINLDSLRRRLLARKPPDVQDGDCWAWPGARQGNRYGKIGTGRKTIGVHVASYLVFVGPVPDGLYVCHNCPGGDNPLCWNPAHLWIGTSKENLADAAGKGARIGRPQMETCPNGHPLSGDNLAIYRRSNGQPWRRCRTCKNERERQNKRRNRKA